MAQRTVCLHAFAEIDGDTTYVEPDDPQRTGWCVYVRTDAGEPGEPFDIEDDEDFATLPEAQARAAQLLAANPGAGLSEY